MKIETLFEKKLKEVYNLLAIPYPPKTLYSSEVEVDVEEIAEENSIEIKPFIPKIKPYNINKDILTCHKATKQLTKFLAEMERMRRAVGSSENMDNTNYIKYKENVVNFIENLSSKAKAEYAKNETLQDAILKETKNNVISDVRRVSNVIQSDKQQVEEQLRRVEETFNPDNEKATLEHLDQLGPIHEQLTGIFEAEHGDVISVIRRMSSSDFVSVSSSGSLSSSDKKKRFKKAIQPSTDYVQENFFDAAARIAKQQNIVEGTGAIGKVTNHKTKQRKEFADNSKRKQSVHGELISNMRNKEVKKTEKVQQEKYDNEGRMMMVLDSLVHKVNGKEVEKQRELEVKENDRVLARRDTLEKIKEYGMRKEVLENADTSYITNAPHDAKAEAAKGQVLANIANPKQSKPVIRRTIRRPTGPPAPGPGLKTGAPKSPGDRAASPRDRAASKPKISPRNKPNWR